MRRRNREEGQDNAETASRPEFLPVADDGHAGPGGDTRVSGAAQSRPDRQRRPCGARRRSRVAGLRRPDRARGHAQCRRRVAPLRVERVQLVLCPNSPHPHVQRRYLVVPGIRSSRIHILDTKPDPRQPRLVKVIEPGDHSKDRLQPAAHDPLRNGRHYVNALGDTDGNGPGGIFMLDPRPSRSKGDGRKIADRNNCRTTSGGTSVTTR